MGAAYGGAHEPASGGDGEDRSQTNQVDVGYHDKHLRRRAFRRRHVGHPGNGGCSSFAFMPGPPRTRRRRSGEGRRPRPARLRWRLGLAERGGPGTTINLELFKATASGWTEQATDNGSQIDYAPEALGVPLAVLVHLGAGLGPETRPDVAAAILVHTASERAPGGPGGAVPWAASEVIRADGGEWLATGYSPGASGPGIALRIYRWERGAWARQDGPVLMPSGQLAGGGSVTAVSLTGSAVPDFVVSSFGADTNWLSVVSDIGGTWHAVPFDYGYEPTVAIDAAGVHGQLVETETNGCGCALGPETYTWELYSKGAFRPTAPPGPAPTCSPDALANAADPAGLLGLAFTRASCADGWALGTGTAPGYANGFVGLFEQERSGWQPVNVDDGTALGRDPLIYDIPLALLDRIGSALGPGAGPVGRHWAVYRDLDAAGSSTLWTVSGEVAFQDQHWLLAAGQPAKAGPRSASTFTGGRGQPGLNRQHSPGYRTPGAS